MPLSIRSSNASTDSVPGSRILTTLLSKRVAGNAAAAATARPTPSSTFVPGTERPTSKMLVARIGGSGASRTGKPHVRSAGNSVNVRNRITNMPAPAILPSSPTPL